MECSLIRATCNVLERARRTVTRAPSHVLPSALPAERRLNGHTFRVFQVPRRNTAALTMARLEYAMVKAQNTPRGPSAVCLASAHASGTSRTQNTPKLIQVGVQVSPAPLNAEVSTMPVA